MEPRNFLKELIKGTFFEAIAKSSLDLVKPPPESELINRQDYAFTTQIMQRVLSKHSNCIDVDCNTGDFLKQRLKFAPLGYHYAFKPIPRLATRLKKVFRILMLKT